MAKHLVEVTDGAGVRRMVRGVDAREIEAAAVEIPEVVDEAVVDEKAFPKNFPGASAFTKAGIGHHAALRMSKKELADVKGISAATAAKIIKLRE